MRIRRAAVCTSLPLIAVFFFSSALGQEGTNRAPKQEPCADFVYSEIKKAPEKARAKRNPLEKDPDAVGAGRILFEQRCAECHGDDAGGGKKGPSLLSSDIQNAEPGAIFWILTNGVVRKGMPVWSKLPEPQRWQLVSFIKSLGSVPAKTEMPPPNAYQSPSTRGSTSRPH